MAHLLGRPSVGIGLTTRQTIGHIVLGGLVGGVVMAAVMTLLPREPPYTALGMAAGQAAGFLTWRPAGFTMQKHLASSVTAGVLIFVFLWGLQSVTGSFF